jgi:hypothetical protein
MVTPAALKREACFGSADGVTIALGLIVSLAGHPGAMWHAATGAGVAELVGMTAGKWLSDSDAGFWVALANGGAALAACLLPAVPALTARGPVAVAAELALVAGIAAVISWLRPERGVLAVAQTYGVLIVAAGLVLAAGAL